jgi:hypothetical protein
MPPQQCLHLAARRALINALALGEAVGSAEASSTTSNLSSLRTRHGSGLKLICRRTVVLSHAADRYYGFFFSAEMCGY